jgi:hypothetical protein
MASGTRKAVAGMTDIYVTQEDWSFECAHCGHAWEDRFEAGHGAAFSGSKVVTGTATGSRA